MNDRFKLVDEREVSELQTNVKLYRHRKTGAQILSAENDDSNKVFGVAFKTPPCSSNGVAHILEHSVLCGSRKYPSKDPFVQMLKGSLQTFLNAITYPDKTIYPVASQNTRDFHNLMDVYLDAVFHPRITPEIFQQEGWHYEIGESGDLQYKGVVYNEMKGNYSSPDTLIHEYSQQSLFLDNIYGLDSGGHPRVIPELDYPEFKTFHETYYHPSNARIFFWGDDDPEERLARVADYLDDYSRLKVEADVDIQSPFKGPRRVERFYAASEGEGDNRITVNWLWPQVTDHMLAMKLRLLSYLLIGTPASPLRKDLIESGLGDDLAGCGYEGDLRQLFFSTGLKGVKECELPKVEDLIMSSLARIVREGFSPDLVQAALNTIEFTLRENNTGRTPQGLAVMLRVLAPWLHDADPIEAMSFEPVLDGLKAFARQNSCPFEQLVDQHLLQNESRSVLHLKPDPNLGERLQREEQERLESDRKAMTADDLKQVESSQKKLQQLQKTPDKAEYLARIPTLSVKDMRRENEQIPTSVYHSNEYRILHHDIFTNGILYLDVGFSLEELGPEDMPYLGLFCQAMIDAGTKHEDFTDLISRIGRKTGGIHPTLFVSSTPNPDEPAEYLQLRGKCVVDQTKDMLDIFRDIVFQTDLENRERMRQIAQEAKSEAEEHLLPAGHLVVNERMQSKLSLAGRMKEEVDGTAFLFSLRELITEIDRDWDAVSAKLKSVSEKIVSRKGMHVNVTADKVAWDTVLPEIERFAEAVPVRSGSSGQSYASQKCSHEIMTVPSQVQYVGKGVQMNEPGYRASGSDLVVTRYLKTSRLWEEIRVQGGAYGAIADLGFFSGIFSMISYRDPQIDRTLEVYDQTASFLKSLELTQEELERAIVGAIGDLDSYKLPDAKGYTALARYLTGRTPEQLQRVREEVLATSAEDFHAFGEKLENLRRDGVVVILGDSRRIGVSEFAKVNTEVEVTTVL